MKRIFVYLVCFFLCLFCIIMDTFAECSYKERKELLELSKKVNVVIEPKEEIIKTTGTTAFSDGEVVIETKKYSFDFLVTGLSDKIYVKYYNSLNTDTKYIYMDDLVDGIYKFNVDDASKIGTYYFKVYSLNKNCLSESFYTKKVVKPKYNYYSEYSVCQDETISKKEYCKKFITKNLNLTEEEFFNEVNKVSLEESKKEVKNQISLLSILKSYWYVGVIFMLVIVTIVVIIMVKKKRERLV